MSTTDALPRTDTTGTVRRLARDLKRPHRQWLAREVVRPGLLLALYGIALLVMLPEGLNRRFVLVLTLAACVVVVGALVAGIVSPRAGELPVGRTEAVAGVAARRRRADAWLLLLPMAPVVQYMLVNRESLSLLGGIVGTAALATLAALFTLAIPYLVQRVMSRTVTTMVGLALTFVLYNMAAFARSNRWHGMEDAVLPLAVFAGIVIGGVVLYRYRRDAAYAIAGAYFVAMLVLVPFKPEALSLSVSEAQLFADPERRSAALATIARGEVDALPDIIFLTYDAYVEDETMRAYGIDNSEQEAYLESKGFTIEPGTYTVAGDSIESMGRVLGGTLPGNAVAGGGPLLAALREAGYRTSGVFLNDYFFSQADPAYDQYFPKAWPSYMTMLRGILEGRFRHDLAFSPTPQGEFVAEKRAVLASASAEPQLIYTHSGPGHSQNSGACLDDETARFETRLVAANSEMREDIETVLEHRPEAIVIVNGDHGPYLTKNCWGLQQGAYDMDDVTPLDIQDRFGSFLAVRWPDGFQPAEADIEVLQDVLPSVLGEIFPDLDRDALRGSTRIADGEEKVIAGVSVEHGVIVGGRFDGMPLFGGPND